MKNRKRIISLGIAVAVIVVAGLPVSLNYLATSRADVGHGPRVGTAVGDSVPDLLFSTLDGEDIRIRDLGDRVVLVNSFASWCGPCRVETPELVAVQADLADELALIGLNVAENRAAVEAYRDDFLVNYPLVLDPGGVAAEHFRPRGLPTSWFIDPAGTVRYVHSGPMTAEMIKKVLADIQAGRQPAPF